MIKSMIKHLVRSSQRLSKFLWALLASDEKEFRVSSNCIGNDNKMEMHGRINEGYERRSYHELVQANTCPRWSHTIPETAPHKVKKINKKVEELLMCLSTNYRIQIK
jgi:hypothetical protein